MEWLPIESAPRDGTEVILAAKDSGTWSGYWEARENHHGECGWQDEDARFGAYTWRHPSKPTHWMPLLEFPE